MYARMVKLIGNRNTFDFADKEEKMLEILGFPEKVQMTQSSLKTTIGIKSFLTFAENKWLLKLKAFDKKCSMCFQVILKHLPFNAYLIIKVMLLNPIIKL